jgi:hypothetical protein
MRSVAIWAVALLDSRDHRDFGDPEKNQLIKRLI